MVSSVDEKEQDSFSSNKVCKSRKRSRHDHEQDDNDHRHTKGSKHKKRDKKSKHRKSRYDDSDDSSGISVTSMNESSNEHRHDRKKRHKRDRHEKAKKDKKHSKKERQKNHDNYVAEDPLIERNHTLANELCNLFDHHPNFADELPIMLIRLGRGATLDLSGMTDQNAARRLTQVFQCLTPFGVTVDDNNVWSWKNPAAVRNSTTNNELVLIRVVRALLDQIGLTLEAIDEYENPSVLLESQSVVPSLLQTEATESVDNEIEHMTKKMLETFRESNLADELAGICEMILDGEMINLDGVPDDTVRQSLESLLILCGLEKSEMEVDDDDDDGGHDNENAGKEKYPPMGYGLPETDTEHAQRKLSSVIHTCQSNPKVATRRPVKGPMLPGAYDDLHNSSDDDDDEGPLPVGAAAIVRDNQLSKEQAKALAARRSYELTCANEGIAIDPESMKGGVREEWMVVPGKHDFLSSIQTGRSRTFASKSKSNQNKADVKVIDPKIRSEINAIRKAYEASRGPSLMDQHRETKRLEQQQQQQNQSKACTWKWDRDKDLDAGRRVDKDALGMILGGAGSDLKNKFQSGV